MRKTAFLLVLALLVASSLAWSANAPGPPPGTAAFAPDEVLVKFKPGTPASDQALAHRQIGGQLKAEIAALGVQVIGVPAGAVEARVAAYSRNPNVEYAEPNYIAYAIGTPNDPYFGKQWGMSKIQAPDAWGVTTGNSGVKIAILDTGIDQDHEDLGKVVGNQNFTDSGTVDDLYGHGTHVAGIAAAATNNGIGVAGVGYNSSLLNVKVLNDQGSGYYSWVAKGIIWAADNGAKVINMSLGGTFKSTTLEDAVNYAWGKGVVLAAAAGNSGNRSPLYPAYYANCIAVAATDENDAKASWSSFGKWVDVAAPGVNIFSTFPNHPYVIGKSLDYDYGSGTSMATPHVAGLAGLVWATAYGTSNTNVRSRIESTADPIAGTGTYWQYGRINAYKAVATVTVDTTPPAQVTGLAVATVSSSQLDLSWNANTELDLNHYNVYQGTVSGGPYTVIASPTENSYSDTGLAAATTYYYVVSAVDNAGNEGGKSAEASGTTSQAAVNKMHVQSIDMALKTAGVNTGALATVSIVDAASSPVSGATVSGHWSDATTDSDSSVTDTSGRVILQSDYVKRAPAGTTFTFTVDKVELSGWTYDPAANVETSNSITVP